MVKKSKFTWFDKSITKSDSNQYIEIDPIIIRKKFKIGILILLFFLFVMLFVFGGINVVLGSVGKGEFRISLGFFGAIPFYITKLFAPALTTYLMFYYVVHRDKVPGLGKLILTSTILCFLIGATWGFKSTAITLLIPSSIVLWQRISLKKFTFISIFTLAVFTSFAVFYDSREFTFKDVKSTLTEFSIEETFDITNLNAFSAILYRLTVVQGNTAWRIWDLHEKGHPMPNYWKTFLSIFGDKALSLVGIDRSNAQEFTDTHYSAATTGLVRRAYDDEKFEHNVTSTAFSDGVLIGGMFGVILIGLLAGFLTKIIKRKILFYLNTHNVIFLSLTLVFFTSYFRTWLNSGGFALLLNISLFVGLGLTFVFLKFFERLSKSKI